MIACPPGGLRAERAPKDPIWRSACSHTFSWGRVNGPPYMTVRSGLRPACPTGSIGVAWPRLRGHESPSRRSRQPQPLRRTPQSRKHPTHCQLRDRWLRFAPQTACPEIPPRPMIPPRPLCHYGSWLRSGVRIVRADGRLSSQVGNLGVLCGLGESSRDVGLSRVSRTEVDVRIARGRANVHEVVGDRRPNSRRWDREQSTDTPQREPKRWRPDPGVVIGTSTRDRRPGRRSIPDA